MSSNKRIAKNTLMLYFRMIIIMLVTLYTSRIVLAALGVEDFGIYNIVGSIVVMFSFLNASMSVATQRFLSFELGRGDLNQFKKVFNIALIIHIFIAVIIFIFAETIGFWFLNTQLTISGDRLNAANWVFQFSILTFMINVTSVPYNAAIISHERMNVFAFVGIIEVLLKLGIVFLLKYAPVDQLKFYAFLVMMVALIIRIVYQLYCSVRFEECHFSLVWDKKMFKQMTAFSGWSLFGGIAYVSKSQGVNILLNIFYGTLINAAWGITQQVSNAILSFIQNFTTAINPPLTKAYASNELDNFFLLIFNGIKYSFFLSYCLVIPVFLETEFILSLWLKEVPDFTVIFVKLMLICILIEASANVIGVAVQATGKIKWYQILVGGMLFLNLPFSYILLKVTNSPSSVMYVAIVLSVLSMLLRLQILYKLTHFPISSLLKSFNLFFLLIVVTIPFALYYQSMPVGYIRMCLTLFTVISLSLTIFIFWGLSKHERFLLKGKIYVFYNNVIKKK